MFIEFADWIVYSVLQLNSEIAFGNALHFFIYDSLKIIFLLYFIITIIAFLRSSLDYEKFRKYIENKPKPIAYILTALLGAMTPFCSCSSIPLFIGFIEASLPFGLAMTFLITSPMINEVAIFVLASVIGIKITAIYVLTGISVGILGGIIMEKLGLRKYLQNYIKKAPCCSKKCECSNKPKTIKSKIQDSLNYSNGVLSKVWLFVLIGIAVGSLIHGYVPQEFFVKYMSTDNLFSVPLAVIVGVPLYADATGIIPIAQALIDKGAAVGTTLAFMMATVALSLPELIILSRVMKRKLILSFVALMFLAFVFVGYLYNAFL